MKIIVAKSDTVKPTFPSPRKEIWLSDIDLLYVKHAFFTACFYKSDGSPDFQCKTVSALKNSLVKVLDVFYPMAGRFCKDSGGRWQIDCNDEGGVFIEANADCDLNDLGHDTAEFISNPELIKACPEVDYSQDLSSLPLLLIQVTAFQCGGISVGIKINNALVDGAAAMNFIKSWSDVARGLDVTVPLFMDRTLLKPRDPPTPKFKHIELTPPPSLKTHETKTASDEDSGYSTLAFKFEKEQIEVLKKKYHGSGLSSFVVMTAHVWKCACKARKYRHDQLVRLRITVDGRRRLNPQLPDGFFGNAIFGATSEVLAKDITEDDGNFAANVIQQTVSKMDDEYLRSALDQLRVSGFNSSSIAGDSVVGMSSWALLPIYEIDFGWGRPVYAGFVGTPMRGYYFILPNSVKDGNLWVVSTSSTKENEEFKKWFYKELPQGI